MRKIDEKNQPPKSSIYEKNQKKNNLSNTSSALRKKIYDVL